MKLALAPALAALTAACLLAAGPLPAQEPMLEAAPEAAEPARPDDLQRLLNDLEQLTAETETWTAQAAEAGELDSTAGTHRQQLEDQAAEHYAETGHAAVVALPTARSFPYGHEIPTLTCLPTRACDIELQADERYLDHALGDAYHWKLEVRPTDPPPGTPDHVFLRPRAFDLRTNLILVTDQRTYYIELETPEEKDGADYAYDHHLTFYDPDAWVSARTRRQREAAAAARPVPSPVRHGFDAHQLNADYSFRTPRRSGRRLGWQPRTVFDDGKTTYIALPPHIRQAELPVLLGRLPDGETYPLNASFRDGWWIVGTTFAEAELVLGTGRKRRSLGLINHGAAGGGAE